MLRHHLVGSAYEGVSVTDGSVTTQVAIAFVDIAGYTAYAQVHGPRALAATLATFESAAASAAGTHGGRLVKLLGDGAMLSFASRRDAVGAALELVGHDAESGGPPARAGVAWGSALTRQGDFYGPVVNLSARLAALGEPGQVIVDEHVAERVDATPLVPVELKGFVEPVTPYLAT